MKNRSLFLFVVPLASALVAVSACSSFSSEVVDSPAVDADVDDASKPVPDAPSPSIYATTVLEDGPLAYWRMNIASGVAIADETGKGHVLTLNGNGHGYGVVGPTADTRDHAIHFDGIGSGAVASGSADFDFSARHAFSYECWASRDASPDGGASLHTLLGRSTGSGGDRKGFLFNMTLSAESGNTSFERNVGAQTLFAAAAGELEPPAAYHHYVTTYDGTTLTLWIDGKAHPTPATAEVPAITADFAVAFDGSTNNFYFAGAIDEIAIYDYALGTAKIQAHRDAATKP